MIPFLKNKKEGSMSAPVEVIERKPDESHEFEVLGVIAQDMMDAVHNKDNGLLKSALEALCEYIQEVDEAQDSKQS